MTNPWLVATCRNSDFDRTMKGFQTYYPRCDVYWPEKIKIFHRPGRKLSDPFDRVVVPALDSNYVFYRLNGTAPNAELFYTQTNIFRYKPASDDAGNEVLQICSDRDIERMKYYEVNGVYLDRLTRSVLLFEGLIGRDYTIPKGLFSGHKVRIIELRGGFVHFEIKTGNVTVVQDAPATLIADLVPKEELKKLEFSYFPVSSLKLEKTA